VGEFSGAIIFGGLTNSVGHKWVFYLSTVLGVIGGCSYTLATSGTSSEKDKIILYYQQFNT
jgi:hypothetical protein